MEKKNNDDKPKIAVALEYTPGNRHQRYLQQDVDILLNQLLKRPERLTFLYMRILSLLILYQNLK